MPDCTADGVRLSGLGRRVVEATFGSTRLIRPVRYNACKIRARPWPLVHTKPAYGEPAVTNPDRQGDKAFLPRIRRQLRHARRWRERFGALFPRYLFVRLDADVGKVNYVLRGLVDRGWLKMDNFRRSDNKLAYLYRLTPQGLSQKAALALRFLRL